METPARWLWEPVHQFAYAGVGNILYFSRDHGANWVPVHTFLKPVRSLLAFAAQNTLYIGLGWDNHIDDSGIFTSNLGGGAMTFHPFAPISRSARVSSSGRSRAIR